MTDRGERPPDGPYGPGWSNDPDHYREIDWGASADRPPRPKTSRNAAIALGLVGVFSLIVAIPGWANGDFDWPQVGLPTSQFLLSLSCYLTYRSLLKKEASDEGS